MAQPPPIQPGIGPTKGPGDQPEEAKKGKFKEELQKVQKISKTDEDSQAKKKRKQQGDIEEEDSPDQTPQEAALGFSLNVEKTTSVFDSKQGTVQKSQIDETAASSKIYPQSGKPQTSSHLLGSGAPPVSSQSSEDESLSSSNQQTQSSSDSDTPIQNPVSSSQTQSQAQSEPSAQPTQSSDQTQEEGFGFSSSDDSFSQQNLSSENQTGQTSSNQSQGSQSSTSPSTKESKDAAKKELYSLAHEEGRLKKELEKLERQLSLLEKQAKPEALIEIKTLKEKLEKELVLVKKQIDKEKQPLALKLEENEKPKTSRLQTPFHEADEDLVKEKNLKEPPKTSKAKNVLDKQEQETSPPAEKPLPIAKKTDVTDMPLLSQTEEPDEEVPQAFVMTEAKKLAPMEKPLSHDDKVEAVLKKQAKEKKQKIEAKSKDQNIEKNLEGQITPQVVSPLELAPQMPQSPGPAGSLPPQIHALFQTMVGLVMIKNMKFEGMEGTRTEVTLNNPEYASSPFYNLKIVITEYQTAPGAYNIELQGNSQQNTLITPKLQSLTAAFADPKNALPFTVNRLEVTLKKEEAEKKLKRVQSTTGGQKDFDDTPG